MISTLLFLSVGLWDSFMFCNEYTKSKWYFEPYFGIPTS